MDYEEIRSGIKAQVNNWGSWKNHSTFNGDILNPLGEDKLSYEVQVGLYLPQLVGSEQEAVIRRLFGLPESLSSMKRLSDAITSIADRSNRHYLDAWI